MATVDLVDLRRDLHRRPEPGWCEFYTTARILRALEQLPVDAVHVGPDAIAPAHRESVPQAAERETWLDRAASAGVDPAVLEQLEGGHTGLVATLECGDGPTVALRVDIDGLRREEASDPDHEPAAAGFRSAYDETMHACGHDAHAAIGVGALAAVVDSEFDGTLRVLFQPAEEQIGGGRAVAESGHLDDVDYLLAVHVGLEHPTGEVIAGLDGFLAVAHLEAHFTGSPSHAGGYPNRGDNAVQALATAVSNLYAIPRHGEGLTRVNAGVVEGGTAANIIPESASLVGEVRGGETELREYMETRAERAIESAAAAHGCTADIEWGASAPSAESDEDLRAVVQETAEAVADVDSVVARDRLGGSEDATILMRHVQEQGGQACYVGIGTDHPGGHHTATFDVDEASIDHGVDVLAGTIERLASEQPVD